MTMQMMEPLCEMFDVIDFYTIPVQLEAFLYLWKSKWSLLFAVFTLNIQNGLSLHIKSVKMFYIFSVTHP